MPFKGFVWGHLAKLIWKSNGEEELQRARGIWISFSRRWGASEALGARQQCLKMRSVSWQCKGYILRKRLIRNLDNVKKYFGPEKIKDQTRGERVVLRGKWESQHLFFAYPVCIPFSSINWTSNCLFLLRNLPFHTPWWSLDWLILRCVLDKHLGLDVQKTVRYLCFKLNFLVSNLPSFPTCPVSERCQHIKISYLES